MKSIVKGINSLSLRGDVNLKDLTPFSLRFIEILLRKSIINDNSAMPYLQDAK